MPRRSRAGDRPRANAGIETGPLSAGFLVWNAVLASLMLIPPASAQGAKASSPPEFARRIAQLKPGEWVWAPAVAPSGPVVMYVDLSRQIAIVYRNGIRIAATSVSSGKPGHVTPTGVFTILQKDANHRSSKYNDAPMPFQERLTWDGVALHAGGLPGYPESHGCVHLPYEFSRQLFAITGLGMTVVIQGNAQNHVSTSENSLLTPFDASGKAINHPPLASGEQWRWQPELAERGPLSIIVSKTDQRIVVIRNGVEIGRAPAVVNDPDPGSHVITLVIQAGKPQWVYIGLPGHEDDPARHVDEAVLNRVRMPRAFLDKVRPLLQPGATILVTNSRVTHGDQALPKITVIDAVPPAM